MTKIRKRASGNVWVGTSGWTYDSWRGAFYPRDVAKRLWLSWHATQFTATEINGSFYRTPSLETVRRWRDQTLDNFLFAWKASKYITHWKRIGKTSLSSLKLMSTRLRALGSKLGPVIFQLPVHFEADAERLQVFLAMGDAMSSSFATKVGTTQKYSRCCARTTPRFAFRIIIRHPRPGR